MTKVRYFIDDVHQPKIQQAVLSVFAIDLKKQGMSQIVKSSELSGLRRWNDVTQRSSHNLALRLMALEPATDCCTVFLPGHVIPGPIATPSRWDRALVAREFSSVADLDIFAVDNAHPDIRRFHHFSLTHPDYESLSRYANLSNAHLPAWLTLGGLNSATQLSQRPCYCALAISRIQWLMIVKKSIEMGLLSMTVIEEDIRAGLVRPSLLTDVKALREGLDLTVLPNVDLDSLFIAPELRLTDAQYQLLRSKGLQKRAIKFANLNGTRKRGGRRMQRYVRWLLDYRSAKFFYSVTLRPVVRRIRHLSGLRK